MNGVALSDDEGDIRVGVSVQGTWTSHTSAAAAPETATNASTKMQSINRQLRAMCDIRICTSVLPAH